MPHPASLPAIELPSTVGSRKINVLIVASSLWIGGAETVMQHLVETIDRRRFNVTICYLKQRGHIGDELAKAGFEIVAVSPADHGGVDYFTPLRLWRLIRSRKIDVVHTHTVDGLVDTGLCKLLMPRLKWVHTFHFGNYPHARARLLRMERIFSRLATRLIAVGENQKGQIKSVHRLSDHAIQTVPNGVTLIEGTGDPTFRSRVAAEGDLLIGTIATFIEQKGLRDLMLTARIVADLMPRVRFVIVGEGHLRTELERLRRDLRLEETVVLTGWVTHAAEVALPTFDIFFQPSLWEAMSVVTLEAMSCGKPVVATRVGEAASVIDSGVDGVLVEPKDVHAMAASLGQLIADPELRARMGAAARRKIEQCFTVHRMTRTYERIYAEMLV